MGNQIEKTELRISELSAEVNSLDLLISAAERSLSSTFADADKYRLASENLEALRNRRERASSALALGELLKKRMVREQELERAADFEKRRDSIRRDVGQLRVKLDELDKARMALAREIAQKDGIAFDCDYLAGQIRQENKD